MCLSPNGLYIANIQYNARTQGMMVPSAVIPVCPIHAYMPVCVRQSYIRVIYCDNPSYIQCREQKLVKHT